MTEIKSRSQYRRLSEMQEDSNMRDMANQEGKLLSELCFKVRDYAVKNHLNVDDMIHKMGSEMLDFEETAAFNKKTGTFMLRK